MREKYKNEVLPALDKIRDLYGITPSELNITQKGFHILFSYDPDCHFIDIPLHEAINNLLGDLLGGDTNARDVARVYRMVGFSDWNGGNRGKIKELKYWKTNKEKPKDITRETIEESMHLIFTERDGRKIYDAFMKKVFQEEKREINKGKINGLDSKTFIDDLKAYFEKQTGQYSEEILQSVCNKLSYEEASTGKYRMLEEGGLPTSGLFLVEKDGIFHLEDYSRHSRSTNLNFFSYWILPTLQLGDDEAKIQFGKILSSAIGMSLNSIPEKKTPMSEKLFYDYFYGRIRFPAESRKVFKEKNPLSSIPQIPSMAKVYFAVFAYIHDRITKKSALHFDPKEKAYAIEYADFFAFAFCSIDTGAKQKHHKKNLIDILSKLSESETLFESEKTGTVGWKRIIDIRFPKVATHRGKKDVFLVVPLKNRTFDFGKKEAFFDLRILSFQNSFMDTGMTDFCLYAEAMIQKSGHDFSLRVEHIYEFLGLDGTEKSKNDTLRKHFSRAVSKLGFFGAYSIQKGKLILSKYKKQLGKKNMNGKGVKSKGR